MAASIPVFGERPKAVSTPKLRALVKFPGTVEATTGISVEKANGTWTFETDWSQFGTSSESPASSTSYLLTYDTATGVYLMVPSAAITGADKVSKSGDTMTGMLVLPATAPTLAVHATKKEYVDTKVAITGDTMTGALAIASSGGGSGGTLYLGNGGGSYLQYSGSAFSLAGGALSIASTTSSTSNTTGALIVAGGLGVAENINSVKVSASSAIGIGLTATTEPLRIKTGTNRNLNVNDFSGSGPAITFNNDAESAYVAGRIEANPLLVCANSASYIQVGSAFGNRWQSNGDLLITGVGYRPGGGSWTDSSDARIKTINGEYAHGLSEIRQITPVRYTFKNNVSTKAPISEDPAAAMHGEVVGREFIGVVAQDIEDVLPETVTQTSGYIDNKPVDDLRIYDSSALVYALVNAVKELAARIEELEGTKVAAPKKAATKTAPKRKKK